MKAVVLHAVNEPVVVEEVELDEVREDEVRVKMAASGVCHSDYSVIDGTIPKNYPIVLGHEGAGVVADGHGSGVVDDHGLEHAVLGRHVDGVGALAVRDLERRDPLGK